VPASPKRAAEGEATLADPGLPTLRTAKWAAGGEPARCAWGFHIGANCICKVYAVSDDLSHVMVVYAADGVQIGFGRVVTFCYYHSSTFISDSPTDSVSLVLKRQCDLTLHVDDEQHHKRGLEPRARGR
jgi:hypothetical protein